jgi:hypothetical protein
VNKLKRSPAFFWPVLQGLQTEIFSGMAVVVHDGRLSICRDLAPCLDVSFPHILQSILIVILDEEDSTRVKFATR